MKLFKNNFARLISVGLILLHFAHELGAQDLLQKFGLERGNYQVGVQHFSFVDNSRHYISSDGTTADKRNVFGMVWIPLENVNGLKAQNYLELYQQFQPNFDPEAYKRRQIRRGGKANIIDEIFSSFDANIYEGDTRGLDHPLIIYYAGYNDFAFSNSVIFEYLASHGFMVVSLTQQGETNFSAYPSAEGLRASVEDLSFITDKFNKSNKKDRFIGLMGHSWGGLAVYLASSKNDIYKSVVCLDPSLTSRDMLDMYEGIVSRKELHENKADLMTFVSGGYHHEYQVLTNKKYNTTILGKSWNVGHPFFTSDGVLFLDIAQQELSSFESFQKTSLSQSYATMSKHILDFYRASTEKVVSKILKTDFLARLEKDSTFSYAIVEGEKPLPSRAEFEMMIQNPDRVHESVSIFHRALLIDPDIILFGEDLILAVAQYYESIDQKDNAKMLFGMAAVTYAESADALYAQGAFFERAGLAQPAQMYYNLALEQDPNHAETLKAIKN